MRRLVVLISGNGSNLQAILDACADGRLQARVVGVLSNRKAAFGLQRAEAAGVPTEVLSFAPYRARGLPRERYDADLAERVAAWRPDTVVLAGFMHVLSPAFIDRFPGRILNLHPALPGELPGTDAIARALDEARAGRRDHTGVMVHEVVPEIDAGPVLGTARVPILPNDDLSALAARVHAAEHRLLIDVLTRISKDPMRRAILSVFDKTGLIELGQGLQQLGFELCASGGSAKLLAEAGLPVTSIDAVTGAPEMLGGRVKTLHPAVAGGILARRTPEHLAELKERGVQPIDLVVCNLYPFQETVANPAVTEADAIEQIDIGGVTLLRAAAKNFESVSVVCEPADYPALLTALAEGGPDTETRRELALKAFRHTAAYDAAISTWLGARVEGDALPETISVSARKVQALRYGENPHQAAALYASEDFPFEQLWGKELSYNNLIDLDAAWGMPWEHDAPCVAIIKHTNPCGLALGADLAEAFQRALACDPVSAFGSIIAVNREVDAGFAAALGASGLFVEVLVAPGYSDEALARLAKRKNCRVMRARVSPPRPGRSIRSVVGGFLVQGPDDHGVDLAAWRVVTERSPTEAEAAELAFAWLACKHVKSNAIVFARDRATVGVGAGQMNRVDSVRLAAARAGARAVGAVLGSDAFFPFPDGVEEAARAGVTAIVQPGGSIRDEEVIAAANAAGLAMVFTGERHFRH